MASLLTNTSFKEIGKDDKPREKALKQGIRSLTDAELMALLFGTGIRGMSVIEMSQKILDTHDGHLSKVADLEAKEFMKLHKGIGPAKSLMLLGALELGRRAVQDASRMPDRQILSSMLAYEVMAERLKNLDHEEFWALFLNNQAVKISDSRIASGGLTATTVDIRMIMRKALESGCTRMIIYHNHPSGQLRPSSEDDALTRRICEAAKVLQIRVDDHLIISTKGYFSYNDEGRMPRV